MRLAEGPVLQRVDAALIGDHARLELTDEVYFWREYTSGKDWTFGNTNQLISNLKREPTRPQGQLFYKSEAIKTCGAFLSTALTSEWLDGTTLVPVPCSKAKADPNYDDRMTRVCRLVRPAKSPNLRELVVQTATTVAAHKAMAEGKPRPTVEDLLKVYKIDEALAAPTPVSITIVDDVLTAGTHYRAMHTVLTKRFPGVRIIGVFVARRIFPDDTIDDQGAI